MPIRVGTWNVRYKSSMDDIDKHLSALSCDIWLLQELPQASPPKGWSSSWHSIFLPCHSSTRRMHGIAILSRLPMVKTRSAILSQSPSPLGGTQTRQYLEALIAIDGRGFVFGCTHLSCSSPFSVFSRQQRQDTAKLIGVTAQNQQRFLLGGDFNAGLRSPGIRHLRRRWQLAQPHRRVTWSRWPFSRHLDHFLLTPDLKVKSVDIGPPGPSDHHPLILEATY